MSDEFNEGDHVYLEDGQVVEYQAALKNGGHLVSPLFERENDFGETDLYPHGNRTVDEVFAKEPVLKYSDQVLQLRKQVADLNRQKGEAQQEALKAKENCEATLASLEKYKGLELLRHYIAGEITHFAVSNYQGIHVSTWDDLMLREDDGRRSKEKNVKFLHLFGDRDGTMTWGIHEYSNFPAPSTIVFPCTSEQMALEKCQEMAVARIARRRAEDGQKQNHPRALASAIEQAIDLGADISSDDQAWLDGYREMKAKEEKNDLLKKRAAIDAKIAKL